MGSSAHPCRLPLQARDVALSGTLSPPPAMGTVSRQSHLPGLSRPSQAGSVSPQHGVGLCRDTAQPSWPLFPSFQLTVEMFDYLECELNLFQTGKPLITLVCGPCVCHVAAPALGRELSEGIRSHLFSMHFTTVVLR